MNYQEELEKVIESYNFKEMYCFYSEFKIQIILYNGEVNKIYQTPIINGIFYRLNVNLETCRIVLRLMYLPNHVLLIQNTYLNEIEGGLHPLPLTDGLCQKVIIDCIFKNVSTLSQIIKDNLWKAY